ncbi:iron-containing alcohol dehydrogenase [Spiractinospora alimapuensis]|nr:iron-containing alcohol dehydrogenase [Spiractinospora alimapuensis]
MHAVPHGLTRPGGAGSVLLAVDRVLVDHPSVRLLVEEFRALGVVPEVVSDFGPELTSDQVDSAAWVARARGVGAVVGVGGGSVLDAAKMIALLVTNDGTSSDWFGAVEPPHRPPELVLVPTTVGTGAEVTRVSMITDGGEKRIAASAAFVPDLVVLDERLVADLPAPVVASTGLDALAHASESILASSSTPLTEVHAETAIRLVTGNLDAAYGGDRDATGRLLVAAYHAGLALNAGVVLGHSLGYAVNHERPLPHGTTTGLALPYTIAYNHRVEERRATLLASALVGEPTRDLRAAAEEVLALVRRVGQPGSLNEAGVPAGVEDAMARRTVELYPRPTNPEPMNLERVRALLTTMRDGDLEGAFAVTTGMESA